MSNWNWGLAVVFGLFTMVCSNWNAVAIAPSKRIEYLKESDSRHDIFATENTYFSVGDANNQSYARTGKLVISEFGLLSLKSGEKELPFWPEIQVNSDTADFWVDHLGNVFVRQHVSREAQMIGKIECCRFTSGRRVSSNLAGFATPDTHPVRGEFGETWSAFVVTGWAVHSEELQNCRK